MNSVWTELDLAPFPHAIRPETHWLYEVIGHANGPTEPLWFSLQLSRETAQELHDVFAASTTGGTGRFTKLIEAGTRMAPASLAALLLALQAPLGQATIGTDILVPRRAFAVLAELVSDGFEIADVGLAVDDSEQDISPPSATITAAADIGPAPDPDKTVIIAIIDDGIGVANQRFRAAPHQTRIAHFLDLAVPSTVATIGPQSADELLARSWTGGQIDQLLAAYPDDEEEIYRALGLIGPTRERRQPLRAAVSHGTHMLDTAAGYDYSGPDNTFINRPIIAAQFPTQVAEDRSDAWLPQSLKRALDWILVKADALSADIAHATGKPVRRLPLIVNCSFGSMAGPQDGGSDVERRISQFVETYRCGGDKRLCTLVLSAGNSLQLRATARLRTGSADINEPLPWRVLPDDKTPSFVQIWLPEAADTEPQQIGVALLPPCGAPTAPRFSKLGKAIDWEIDGVPYARVYHQRVRRAAGQSRECITICIRATAEDGEPAPLVPHGLWGIKVENLNLANDAEIDLHIHRDDAGLFARGKGRQSYFDDPRYQRYDGVTGRALSDERLPLLSPVILTHTLNAYAGGEGMLVIGGYRHSDGEPAAYSSSGPTNAASRTGPDLAAVSEESPAFRGILAAGTSSGSVAILNGTSVAAPLATRRLADIVAGGGSVGQLIADVVAFEAANPSGPHGTYHPATKRQMRWGVGRLPFSLGSGYRGRIEG